MADLKSYRVHDVQGNIYGPADANTLRQWVGEGRIVAGMSIAEEGTTEWCEVSMHPALADLFGRPAPLGMVTDESAQVAAPVAHPDMNPRPELVGYASAGSQQMSVLALISMVTGILGLFLTTILIPLQFICCGVGSIGFPLDLCAVITGILSLQQIRTNSNRYTGKALAITGLICGGIALLIFLAVFVGYVFLILASRGRGHI